MVVSGAGRDVPHLWRRLLASALDLFSSEAAAQRRDSTRALVAFVLLLLVIQSYWVFVLTHYVDLLESGGRTAIVVAGPDQAASWDR